MNQVSMMYVTSNNIRELEEVIAELLQQKLIACANVLGGINSFFFWKGEVKKESEVAALLKLPSENAKIVINKIENMHSYDCPCILELPILSGSEPYKKWLLSI